MRTLEAPNVFIIKQIHGTKLNTIKGISMFLTSQLDSDVRPLLRMTVVFCAAFFVHACADSKDENSVISQTHSSTPKYDVENIELEGRTIELTVGPNKFECVLEVALDDLGIQGVGEIYNRALENEIRYEHHLGVLTGYQYFSINDSANGKDMNGKGSKLFKYVPSYFDCEVSKIVFDKLYKKYHAEQPPFVHISTQVKYDSLVQK